MQINQSDLDLYHNEMQDLVEEFDRRDLVWPLLRLAFSFPSKYLRLLLDKFTVQITKRGENASLRLVTSLRRVEVDIDQKVRALPELRTELERILARDEIRSDLASQEL